MSATAPAIGIDPEPLPSMPGRRGRRGGWARTAELVLGVLVVAMLTTELVVVGPTIGSAVAELARSSTGWLTVAMVAALASMIAFAAVRQQTLRAAGVAVPLRTAVAVSYAAGALHTTLPGGTVLSTAYAYRHLRSWGASAVVATWCLTVTGLLATATLSVIGLTGLLLGGGADGSVLQSIAGITVLLVGMAGIVRLTRNPDRLGLTAGYVLRWINRLRRRPAESGYAVLAALIDDLQAIRLSPRAWLAAWTLSMLNWAFDAACLAACLASLGVHVGFVPLLLTYTAGMAASSLTAVPGGLGVVEAALTVGLTTAGVPVTAALGAVLIYRILSLGGVVVIGWTVLAAQRLRSRTAHEPTPSAIATLPAIATAPSGPNALPRVVEDDARCGPGGPQRPIRASEVMTGDYGQVAPTDSWQKVARTMRTLQATAVPVCDEHGELRGIVDYRDIGVRCLAGGESAATARTLTRDTPFTVGINDPVTGIAQRMAEHKAWLLPVLDGRRLVGVIHYADILTGGAAAVRAARLPTAA